MKPLPLKPPPGIKLDGTVTQGDFWTDGLWTRFNSQLRPEKMLGYRNITDQLSGPIYGMNVTTKDASAYIHTGSAEKLEQTIIDMNGSLSSSPADRTPAGFSTSSNNVWQMDVMFDPAGTNAVILARASTSLSAPDNADNTPLYWGPLDSTAALTATTANSLSGGVCVLYPFAFQYGNDGRIEWSDAGQPNTWTGGSSGGARVAVSKIIKGMKTRAGSGSQAPAGLFWSLDAVIRATYIGGTDIFRFDTVADQTTPLSSRGMIDYDGVAYWAASDRFLRYNGVVQEVPNNLNIDFFFDNLRCADRQKVFALKIPRRGEIWWCAPLFGASYPNYAIIHNVRLNTWYHTVIPETGRTDGFYPTVFRYPVMTGAPENSKHVLWQHELRSSGENVYDKISDGQTSAIRSYVTTPDLSIMGGGSNRNINLQRLEPDINQTGEMKITRLTRPFPRSEDTSKEVALPEEDAKLDSIYGQGRFMRLKFESNVQGGYYEMGDTILQIEPGDERPVNS